MIHNEIWEVDKFLVLDSVISSKTFRAGRGIWKMKLYPLGNRTSKGGQYVGVYLQLVDLSALKNVRSQGIYATPRFILLDENGNKIWSERKAGYEAKERRFVLSSLSATIYGYSQFIPRKYLVVGENRFLPDGKLVLRCRLQIREGCRNVDEIPVVPDSIVDFSELLKTARASSSDGTAATPPTLSDVSFRVDGSEFGCHKAIVARKSDIFKDLFIGYDDNDAFEISTTQEFDLELKAPIFQDALLHVYGNTPRILLLQFSTFNRCWSSNIKKLTSLMLLAAKYEIKDLTQFCEAKLIELFRARSLDLVKKVKKVKKGIRKRQQTEFFHFDDKPFSLQMMTQIANHVTASCLSVYLATCNQHRLRA